MIPVNEPVLDGNELKYLTECIKTGWISSEGPFVHKFEQLFAPRVGRAHGIAVANGSVALDVAVAAVGVGAGDEVIMPTFTIISCAAAVVRAGAKPILVDSDDPALATRCSSLRNLCFQKERRFVHQELGWNFRMTNLQAALGLAQLERLDEFVGRKRTMGRLYTELLQNVPGIQLPLART